MNREKRYSPEVRERAVRRLHDFWHWYRLQSGLASAGRRGQVRPKGVGLCRFVTVSLPYRCAVHCR